MKPSTITITGLTLAERTDFLRGAVSAYRVLKPDLEAVVQHDESGDVSWATVDAESLAAAVCEFGELWGPASTGSIQ